MKKTIVIINGRGGCGKDTLVKFVQEQFPTPVWNVNAADPIKDMVKPYGYDDDNKTDRWRRILSLLKEAWTLIDETPLKYLWDSCNRFMKSPTVELMFVHIREPEEIDKFKSSLRISDDVNLYTLLIKREDTDNKTYGNKSDDGVENYDYDFVFVNKDGENIDKHNFMVFFRENIMK